MFTDSPFQLGQAESDDRGHAIIEQVFAELIDRALVPPTLQSVQRQRRVVALAVTAHALTRALGTLASVRHAVARGATLRTELIQAASRPARSGRDTITWHLPQGWPWQHAWNGAFHASHRAPQPWPPDLDHSPKGPQTGDLERGQAGCQTAATAHPSTAPDQYKINQTPETINQIRRWFRLRYHAAEWRTTSGIWSNVGSLVARSAPTGASTNQGSQISPR